MNRTLLKMRAENVHENQKNWASQLPFVLMAYQSSVYGYTP